MTRFEVLVAALKKLSKTEDNRKVLSEWDTTGDFEVVPDGDESTLTCVCGCDKCRTLYGIENMHTGELSAVGSKCVMHFREEFRKKTTKVKKRFYDEKKQKILNDHGIDPTEEYYVWWQKSVFCVPIKCYIDQKTFKITIKYKLFGNDELGKVEQDIETFKSCLASENEYDNYLFICNREMQNYNLDYYGKVRTLYRDDNGDWVVLYKNSTTAMFSSFKRDYDAAVLREIKYYRRELKNIVRFVNECIKEGNNTRHRFDERDLFRDIDKFLVKFKRPQSCIKDMIGDRSNDILIKSHRYDQSINQLRWIARSCIRIRRRLC